jgi:hypothetical protein
MCNSENRLCGFLEEVVVLGFSRPLDEELGHMSLHPLAKF